MTLPSVELQYTIEVGYSRDCYAFAGVIGQQMGCGGSRVGPQPDSFGRACASPPQWQLDLVEMIKAKKSGAGHKVYKVCRSVLKVPIVAEDTYCLEITAEGELRGEGEVNAQGEREGRGTMVYAAGDMFEGQWLAGKFHGHGKYTTATGNVYEGEFANDQFHGRGMYSFVNGNMYEGEWAEEKRHGRGKDTYADGGSYDGEYANGEKHGMGTYTYADGEVDVGCYEAGADVGQGVRWSADRATAWELQAGAVVGGIPLDEAAKIAERIGLPPP